MKSILVLLLLTHALIAHVNANDATMLALGYDDQHDQFFASITHVDTSTGQLSFGVNSSLYSLDSSLQPCINTKFNDEMGETYYAIETFNNFNYGFDIVAQYGTVRRVNFTLDGRPVSYLVVAWSYSENLEAFISIGWQDDTTSKTYHTSHKNDKFLYKGNDAGAEVASIDPMSGQIKSLVKVPGYAFLECASLVSGNWFHYMYEDESEQAFTMSVNLRTGEFYPVSFPKSIFGLILNFASLPQEDSGSTFVVTTELGYVHLVYPEAGYYSLPIAQLNVAKYGQVQLASSVLFHPTLSPRNSTLTSILTNKSQAYLANLDLNSKLIDYSSLHNDVYDVGFWNLK